MSESGQNRTVWPEDGKYRGIEIPRRLKATWNNMSGRWWKQGVDDVLDANKVPEEQIYGTEV